jgi:3-dehydroquinate synthetase/shikimate kinase
MDVVLVGLPGSGKTAVGRRLARRHDAEFVDLDARIEADAGMSVAEIFAAEGETGFRRRERKAISELGPPDPAASIGRVVAPGGGAVMDPRNRWRLYRGRRVVWLDGRPEVIAQRLRRSPNVRPLVAGRDPIGAIRALAGQRERFYAPGRRVPGMAELPAVVDAVEAIAAADLAAGTTLLVGETRIGRLVVGSGNAGSALVEALGRLGARRALVVTEPLVWAAVGSRLGRAVEQVGMPLATVVLPTGEEAKRLAVIEEAATQLAGLRAERGEPIVAVGGGAVGDAAGFLAATWLRGVPLVHVPTTLVAQVDSSIGGKTAIDLPAGKNLVGAFHQPTDVVIDVDLLRSLPGRESRAALGEAVKMGLLGDERLLELLETRGPAIAIGKDEAFEDGSVAELVERCAWAKVEVVVADEHETGDARIRLNLGHSVGHAIEAADGYVTIRHGEAVGYGLRAAARIGHALDITPAGRRDRAERLLDRLGLGIDPLPYPAASVIDALTHDKKHRGGRLRWVLPTADGSTVSDDVPGDLIERIVGEVLAGRTATTSVTGR